MIRALCIASCLLLCSFVTAPANHHNARPRIVKVAMPAPALAMECYCRATTSEPAGNDVTLECADGSVGILLIPMEPRTSDGACDVRNNACATRRGSICRFTGKVRVSFSAGSCYSLIWVQGGTTFPTPRLVNASVDVNLDISSTCQANAQGHPTGSSGGVSLSHSSGASAVASYHVDLHCAACAEKKTEEGQVGQAGEPR
ncbi:MAG: hypothetical protein IPK26_27750 [Planctomycetes bacterium]|nr:hypothetical protein [Planctomycetota bacterium]